MPVLFWVTFVISEPFTHNKVMGTECRVYLNLHVSRLMSMFFSILVAGDNSQFALTEPFMKLNVSNSSADILLISQLIDTYMVSQES